MEEITRDNYKKIDIRELALNPRFGSLTFDNSAKKLEKARNWFNELEEFNYSDELPQNVVNDIDHHLERLLEYLNWLRNFDIATSSNAKQEHDDFERKVDSFYNDMLNNFITRYLHFLKDQVESRSKDKGSLRKEQKELQQARKKSEEIVVQLQEALDKLQKEKSQVEATKGEIAAIRFGKYFEAQSRENRIEAKRWLILRDQFFKAIMWIVLANFSVYFYLFVAHRADWWPYFRPNEFFTVEYGIVKFALIALLSYGLAFCSRNYNIQSNLETSNSHRKNVAETLTDFLNSNPTPEDRSELIKHGTDSMFKHQPIGYVPKVESRDDGPISSIINNIPALRHN